MPPVPSCASSGVSEINPDSNVGVFFATHIQPELQEANINNVPVVKASCIKFVCTFRNQLPKAGLVALLPIVANFLRSTVYVPVPELPARHVCANVLHVS